MTSHAGGYGVTSKTGYVYIMTNKNNTVLYTGVTSDLQKRVWQHREELVEGFTKRYNVVKLVYYERCPNMLSAIAREKQLKGGSRQKKVDLINGLNPEWRDLYEDLYGRHCEEGDSPTKQSQS
jgi:putative endonuclease